MTTHSNIEYKLSDIPGFHDFIKNGEIKEEYKNYYFVNKYSTKANENYNIVRYSKSLLSADYISSYGLLRSLIISNNRIVAFAPPKSMSADNFIFKYPVKTENIIAEEFV